MQKKTKIALGAAGAVLVLGMIGSCGSDSDTESAAPATVTATVTATQEAAPVEETETKPAPKPKPKPKPAPEPTTEPPLSDEEIGALALEITWDGMSASDQADICLGWALDQESMLDVFLDSSGGIVTRAEAREFFDGKCN